MTALRRPTPNVSEILEGTLVPSSIPAAKEPMLAVMPTLPEPKLNRAHNRSNVSLKSVSASACNLCFVPQLVTTSFSTLFEIGAPSDLGVRCVAVNRHSISKLYVSVVPKQNCAQRVRRCFRRLRRHGPAMAATREPTLKSHHGVRFRCPDWDVGKYSPLALKPLLLRWLWRNGPHRLAPTGSGPGNCPSGETGFVLTGHVATPASQSGETSTITTCFSKDTGTNTTGNFYNDVVSEAGGNKTIVIATAQFDPTTSSIQFS